MSGGIAGAAQDRSRVIALSRATSSKRDTFRGTFMIAIRRRHDLGLTKAKRLAQTLAHQLQNEFGGTYTWEGNELRFQRTGVSGCATVTTDSIQIRVELGLLLRPLHARIEREIRAGLDAHLGHEDARRAGRSPKST